MSEPYGHLPELTPELDDWSTTVRKLVASLSTLTINETARTESQIVTDSTVTDSDNHKHPSSQIGNGDSLRKVSSDPTLGSQASGNLPASSSYPSLSSVPSSFISSHHRSSYSSSTIHPPVSSSLPLHLPAKSIDPAPGPYPNPLKFRPQVDSALDHQTQVNQSQAYHIPLESIPPRIYHNPLGLAPQWYKTRILEPDFSTFDGINMGWPFQPGEVPNNGDFERFESSSIEELLQPCSIPFGSIAEMHTPSRNGVLMISNIPYTVTRQEVTSFIGRSANLLPSSQGCPIHIIMERSTGKTMDCYVEFRNIKDAEDTVKRINHTYDAGSTPRMGNRHVDIELSTPAKLHKAIFPRAKCISWENGKPVQLVNKDEWSTGFDGFLTDEELFCLVRHAEQPHRSVFASKVPQRCYESFITTVWKFPWHATHLYTVHHRNAIFKTLGTLIKTLADRMQKSNTVGLDVRLLSELVHAGIHCPGFNPRMKYCFAWWSRDINAIAIMDHDWCLYFPFDSLVYIPGHGPAAIQFYAYIMSNGSVLRTESDGLINKHTHPEIEQIFGKFWFEWDDNVARNKVFRDAINYEATVLRKFIITGFQQLHKRKSSISTIGTAPGSSPTHSVTSVDSERTISASRGASVDPSRASRETSIGQAGNNRNVPGTSRVSSQRIDEYPPDTPTPRPRASAAPYRPPHQRDPSVATKPRNFSWRLSQSEEVPVAGSTHGQSPIRPIYHAPHQTAQNVRSSSDPFGPVPPVPRTGHRSRSDATRLSNVDHKAFDEIRAAKRSGKK
ncbi:Nucleotide-binding alpha-beta plait [Penicillium vulpinum]|uniref:RRM domain-containing protein n=1 Tax=Penicillium vulpinum TaxID=29845 RepID=A0A1V6RY01_9EURO|nr:Nucleotide-binding alpha-beta plait [Penicillium vulpinum]KAJ5952900.1 Nucleotide-binding alpha-beta plait [Penicillium vulpinum]OQE06458.1 hypothetical protein PENVUL_c018G07357 [Penicillium vulpinum]